MFEYTYTIFDSNPTTSGPSAWPTHNGVGIRARALDSAEDRIIRLARREARECGAYRQGDRLWYIIWDDGGVIAREGSISLCGRGLGPAYQAEDDEVG